MSLRTFRWNLNPLICDAATILRISYAVLKVYLTYFDNDNTSHPKRKNDYGRIGGVAIPGADFTDRMLFPDTTLDYRKYGLPHNLLAVENCDE